MIVGALSFRNQYDGHTIEQALEQYERLLCKEVNILVGDRGYRGKTKINNTQICIPKPEKKSTSRYKKNKIKKQFHRRAAIEPVIGHLKREHRLGRNFYKGVIGDSMNIILASAAFNFKRMMRRWKSSLCQIFQRYIYSIIASFFQNKQWKMTF